MTFCIFDFVFRRAERAAELRRRFEAGREVRGPDECWPWVRSLNSHGYGSIKIPQCDTTGAHRVAYALHTGKGLGGLHVLHHCDNRRCCNPAHLFLGTNADNVADKVAKGRSVGRRKLSDTPATVHLNRSPPRTQITNPLG